MLKYVGSYVKDGGEYPIRHVWQSEGGFLVNKEFGPEALDQPATMKLWSGSSLNKMVQHWSTQRQISRPVSAAKSLNMVHNAFKTLLPHAIDLQLPPDDFVTEETVGGAPVILTSTNALNPDYDTHSLKVSKRLSAAEMRRMRLASEVDQSDPWMP